MNTQALHLDAAFSDAQPPFHQRLVNSMFTLSTLVGLSVANSPRAPSSATSASPRSPSQTAVPRRHALRRDRDHRQARVEEPAGEGIVTFAHTGRNQHGDIVATASRKTMVRKPDAAGLMSLTDPGPAWLFCPADRPERFESRGGSRCGDPRPRGRRGGQGPRGRARSGRQPARSGSHRGARQPVRHHRPPRDLEAVARTPYTTVMLAKTESADQVRALAPWTSSSQVETPLGALAVTETARVDNAFAVMGAPRTSSPSRRYRQPLPGRVVPRGGPARSIAEPAGRQGVRQARAGLGVPRHQDLDGLRAEVDDAVSVGFDVKVAIHPSQIAGHPGRLRTRPGQVSGRDTCWRRPAKNVASSRSRA